MHALKKKKIDNLKAQLTLIDLFAGCGGLSLGLEEAGFTPVFVNELNQDAMSSYLVNRLAKYPWLAQNNVNDVGPNKKYTTRWSLKNMY